MHYSSLLGNPVEHSVSHILFEELSCRAGIAEPYKHIKINVKSDELAPAINALSTLKFMGANITLPYKRAVIPLLDATDKAVEAIGAVNTITFSDTKVFGTNTDWFGIVTAIERFAPKHNINTVTVFGSGGASRAAIFAAKKLGTHQTFVLYRDEVLSQNSQSLCADSERLGIYMLSYSDLEKCVSESSLIINATSAGMKGMDPIPFALSRLDDVDLKKILFLDVVFNPLRTPLLDYLAQRGTQTIDGLWMMIYQAVLAMRHWLKREIILCEEDLDDIHKRLSEELNHD